MASAYIPIVPEHVLTAPAKSSSTVSTAYVYPAAARPIARRGFFRRFAARLSSRLQSSSIIGRKVRFETGSPRTLENKFDLLASANFRRERSAGTITICHEREINLKSGQLRAAPPRGRASSHVPPSWKRPLAPGAAALARSIPGPEEN